MKIRFLLDENLPPKLKTAVLRINPAIDILRVGDSDAPPLGTLDPDILCYLELAQRLLVTDNRKSIPGHLEEHWAVDGHIWGVVWLRPSGTIGSWAESLFLIWRLRQTDEIQKKWRENPIHSATLVDVVKVLCDQPLGGVEGNRDAPPPTASELRWLRDNLVEHQRSVDRLIALIEILLERSDSDSSHSADSRDA